MTAEQAHRRIVSSLLGIYDAGEATAIAFIVLEDAFGIHNRQVDVKTAFTKEQELLLESIIERLLAHEPVQYVVGKAYFYGSMFKVSPVVLIPRQETEELVAWVLETVGPNGVSSWQSAVGSWPQRGKRLLDIGTGSGCIPIAIKKKLPLWEVHALDVSEAALEIAEENALLNGADVHFHQTNILLEHEWETLPMFDVIVSNPPYITEAEKQVMPKNVLEFEPHLALFTGGADAQVFYKKIAEFALWHLAPDGALFFETNEFHAHQTKEMLEQKGYLAVETKKDLNGKERMISARKPSR